LILKQALWLWALTLLITAAIILAVPTAPATVTLRDSFKPETTTVVAPLLKSVKGKATWYDAAKNNAWYTQGKKPTLFYAAAGPALREIKNFKWGKKPYRVIVENLKNGKAIVAWVVDWCQCRGQTNNQKLVDLSPAAFTALGVDLYLGVQRVRVTVLP
jgi:rare lipoprotein A (peptidoglycan hydrolase)